MLNLLWFTVALIIVVKSVDLAIKYSAKVAQHFGLSKHAIGFLLIAGISVLPETVISLSAAISDQPAFGLGTLFGSNVADLTLIFGVIILLAPRAISISSTILASSRYYAAVLAIPLLLGLDGHFNRIDGLVLICVGLAFHMWVLRGSKDDTELPKERYTWKDIVWLLVSLGLLIGASQLTVHSGVEFAHYLNVKPILIGLFLVALGTTLPELLFSIRAVKQNHPSLALGDMLGTVLTDATIVIGLVALINPFAFSVQIIYVTGLFMLVAALLLFYCMKTGRTLTRVEGVLLLLFYILFVITEALVNT